MVDCVSAEKEERQRIFFYFVVYNTFRIVGYITATHMVYFHAGAAYPCRATRFPVQVIHHLR